MTDPVDVSDSLAYRIYRVQRLLRRQLVQITSSVGSDLSPEQWFVLNKLALRPGQALVELGDAIFADRPNLTRIVAGLERRDLVRREKDPEDGRRVLLFLTAEGRAVQDAVAAVVPGERADLFAGISAEDLARTEDVLEQIEQNILKH